MVHYPDRADLMVETSAPTEGVMERGYTFDAAEGLVFRDLAQAACQGEMNSADDDAREIARLTEKLNANASEKTVLKPVVVVKHSPFNLLALLRELRTRRAIHAVKKKRSKQFDANSGKTLEEQKEALKWSQRFAVWASFIKFAQRLARLRRIATTLKKKDMAPVADDAFGDDSLDFASVTSSTRSFSPSLNDSNKSLLSKKSFKCKKYHTSPANYKAYHPDDDEDSICSTDLIFDEVRRRNMAFKKVRTVSQQYLGWNEESCTSSFRGDGEFENEPLL